MLPSSMPSITAGPIKDSGETVTTFPTMPASGNLLDNAVPPPGTTLAIVGFKVPGTTEALKPGTGPVTLTDPATGIVTGTLVVQPTGVFTFTPAPGYVGPAPAITYSVRGSDGQANPSQLTIDVLPRRPSKHASLKECFAAMHA